MPDGADDPLAQPAAWAMNGDPALLTSAAALLRDGIDRGFYRGHPPGEYTMFGVARILDAVALQVQNGERLHHTVVSAAMEIARHVTTYLPQLMAEDDADRGPES
ncbi:hypothetical protein BJF78_11985 [Pseudonocardia sp. CNS-139]|nr:hypothetical protein BJF78_11985 [Pseudonocardia sp. CNS-139]